MSGRATSRGCLARESTSSPRPRAFPPTHGLGGNGGPARPDAQTATRGVQSAALTGRADQPPVAGVHAQVGPRGGAPAPAWRVADQVPTAPPARGSAARGVRTRWTCASRRLPLDPWVSANYRRPSAVGLAQKFLPTSGSPCDSAWQGHQLDRPRPCRPVPNHMSPDRRVPRPGFAPPPAGATHRRSSLSPPDRTKPHPTHPDPTGTGTNGDMAPEPLGDLCSGALRPMLLACPACGRAEPSCQSRSPMRSTLRVLLASLLVAAFAAPVAAASSGGATQETISGVLEAIHVDEFATGREREDYALRTAHGVIPLEFADGGPDGDGGATVTVTGTRSGGALRVQSSHAAASFRVTRRPTPGVTETVQAESGASSAGGGRSRPPASRRPRRPAPWPRTSPSSSSTSPTCLRSRSRRPPSRPP